MPYPREQYCIGQDSSVLQCNRQSDKTVAVKPNLPCNVIVIHGVNDVGTSYNAVEQGLCAGLDVRLHGTKPGKQGRFVPAPYRMPTAEDKDKLEPDPDDVFFKRQADHTTHSPVIPFYWGFRETKQYAKNMKNGQHIDRFGNRLDKDLSKGGGPFANATSSLPDMWNRGVCSPADVGGDPVRPLLSAPGRMYMILAAKRLAALIAMIHDYDANEVVNIVAHSQGCLISLLAQAFLLQENQRPADTLILTHPPYSLEEDTTPLFDALDSFKSGTDEAMDGQYGSIKARQTFDARLRTLANIVSEVAFKKNTQPALTELFDQGKYHGMVGAKWIASGDRDNRGKVYLYFCPEDMTVALDNIRGIGWQGVPDVKSGTVLSEKLRLTPYRSKDVRNFWLRGTEQRKPLAELGKSFFQRVFTNKQRFDPSRKTLSPVLVGLPPHDFALRTKDENDHAHVAGSNRGHRGSHKESNWPHKPIAEVDVLDTEAGERKGIRTINGEKLNVPTPADLRGNQIDPKDIPKSSDQSKLPTKDQGPCEEVDPIESAIAATSGDGLKQLPYELIDDPRPNKRPSVRNTQNPGQPQPLSEVERREVEEAINHGNEPGDRCKVRGVYSCPNGQLMVFRNETPNEARKRWQHEVSPKSFHGAIIGSANNHRNVTAYDIAIGGGQASSDPHFYKYLCAVADWRLQANTQAPTRSSILRWGIFVSQFNTYWNAEPIGRRNVIYGNAQYYSTGNLPKCVPSLNDGLTPHIICETMDGKRTTRYAYD